MKTILILGSGGMLGSMVNWWLAQCPNRDSYRIINHLRSTASPLSAKHYITCDVTMETASFLMKEIQLRKPDYIINCIGVIKPQMKNTVNAIFINSVFPHYLCKSNPNSRVIHVTTDCVFDGGVQTAGADESIPHSAKDDYGKSKSLGEPNEYNCLNLRTSIIGPEIRNCYSLIESVRKNAGGVMEGYMHHWWNGVTTLTLAKLMGDIIDRDWFKGNHTRHVSMHEPINKFELVTAINDRYNLNIKITAVKAANAVDRSIRTLHRDEMYNEFIAKIPNIQAQLNDLPF